jgi:hypothetical protein
MGGRREIETGDRLDFSIGANRRRLCQTALAQFSGESARRNTFVVPRLRGSGTAFPDRLKAELQTTHFSVAKTHFVMQSSCMETDWAAEHLQTIRTLMERSAVYRRALAPIMLFVGALGAISSVVGSMLDLNSVRSFATMWLVTAIITIGGAFVIARRQAFKEREEFWSPPTRRIAQAMAPPLTVGLLFGIIFALENAGDLFGPLVFVWALLYGCAVHAAGFFISRGMRLFGWVFIVLAGIFIFFHECRGWSINPNEMMGFFFGGLHLACGLYLYITEKGKNAA